MGGTVPASVRSRRSVKRAGWRSWRVTVDQTLRCRECGVDFIWTAGEQEFYASRGLTNPPSRCPSCRAARKAAGGGGGGFGGGGGGGGGFGGGRGDRGPRGRREVSCASS